MICRNLVAAVGCLCMGASQARAQDSSVVVRNDSVTIRLIDADLRSAVTMLARFLDKPVIFGNMQGARVTLEAPRPVPTSEVGRMVRALVEGQNMEFAFDSAANVYRVRARETQRFAPRAGPGRSGTPGDAPELFVIHLKHARAADVAATANLLYGKSAAIGEPGAPPSTLAQDLRQRATLPPDAPLPQAVTSVAGRPAALTGDVTIVPDQGTNSLLVRASPTDFTLIQAVVQAIDIRPLQVLIEVVIAEVRKDRSFTLGVDGNLPATKVGSSGVTAAASTKGIGLGDFVLKVMNVGGVNADFALRAAAERGDVRILSRPIVLAANNQVADITVGSQRPFVMVQRSLPTDAAQRDQVVQYRDVGTQLTVKPTISADGYVMLQVTQQVNQATNEVQFDAPIISTRSVQTQLLVKDGQTVVLGGISDHQAGSNSGGVPLLSRLPLVGALFGRQGRSASETELFLFLKPVVLFSDEDARRATELLQQKAGTAKVP